MASLSLDWIHVVAFLGAIQGVFLAGALATKRRNRKRPSCGPLPPFTIAHPSSYRTI